MSYIPLLSDMTAVLHKLTKKQTNLKEEQRHKGIVFDTTKRLLEATKLSMNFIFQLNNW